MGNWNFPLHVNSSKVKCTGLRNVILSKADLNWLMEKLRQYERYNIGYD